MDILMEISLIFVAGIIGFIIPEILKVIKEKIKLRKETLRWRKSEKIRERFHDLQSGIEVVQAGWKAGVFGEDQVVVTADSSKFKLNEEIYEGIYKNHLSEWTQHYLENNLQYGVNSIFIHRVSDENNIHELRIKGQIYSYYDYLSTNKIFQSGSDDEKKLLKKYVDNPVYEHPVPHFPNPLSVGLSVFCENGDSLVLTRRSNIPASGGHHSPNTIYNAVGENSILSDSHGYTYEGDKKLSPWQTAKRGLQEEMGIAFDDKTMKLVLHTFTWDRRILDYKFFGYVRTPLSRFDTENAWMAAQDKSENLSIEFHPCSDKEQIKTLITQLISNKGDWSDECILCTIYSLLHLKQIPVKNMEEYLG